MRHHVGGVDEELVTGPLNLGVEHDVLCPNAPFFEEPDLTQVGHPMSAVHPGVVRDGHQFALGLGAVAGPGGHEFGAKGHVSTLGAEGVVVRRKVGAPHRSDLGVVEPTHQFGHPVQRRNGVVVGKEDQVVVHLVEGVVARIGPVAGRVFDPRGAVLLAHRFGVVFGLGVGDDHFEMRVGLLAQPAEHNVQFVGIVDGRDEHGRFVRRTVGLHQHGHGAIAVAHGNRSGSPPINSRAFSTGKHTLLWKNGRRIQHARMKID